MAVCCIQCTTLQANCSSGNCSTKHRSRNITGQLKVTSRSLASPFSFSFFSSTLFLHYNCILSIAPHLSSCEAGNETSRLKARPTCPKPQLQPLKRERERDERREESGQWSHTNFQGTISLEEGGRERNERERGRAPNEETLNHRFWAT